MRLRHLPLVAAFVVIAAACGTAGTTTTTAPPASTTTSDTAGTTTTSLPPEAVLEEGPLTIGIWGGIWETAIADVAAGFTAETGAEVIYDISASNDRVAKLQLDSGSMDIAFLTPEAMAAAEMSGLVAYFDEGDVPNLEITIETLREGFKAEDGYFAVPVSWTATGILWREDLVPFEIKSVRDLWRPELAGKVSIQNMPTLGAASFLISAAVAHGGSQENLEPGWEALAELRPNIQQFFSVSSDALSALVAGDLWAVSTIASQGIPLLDQNVRITLAEDGVTYSIQAAAVTAGTEKPNLAKAFLNYLMRQDVQAIWAESGRAAPGAVGVELSEAAQEFLVETPELVPNLIPVDFIDMAMNMEAWTERWTREVAR